MKVLVTGASGYIGKHVVKQFLNSGHEVIAVDLNHKGIDERASIIDEPIFNGNADIYSRLDRPDLVVHLAWRDGFIHNSSAHMNDLSLHVRFLEDMINGGLKNLTVMGSMHEVGYYVGRVDENTPCCPLSMYGIAKNALRQAMLLYVKEKDVNFHWLRAFYIYGDDMHGSSIFSKILQAEEDGKKTFPFTMGKNKYDFIQIEELTKQITMASLQSEVTGIINVCSGIPIALADKVEEFIKEKNLHIKLEYGAYPEREYDSPAIWGDNSKMKYIEDRFKEMKG